MTACKRALLLALSVAASEAQEDCGSLPPSSAPTAAWFTNPRSRFKSASGTEQPFVGAAGTTSYSPWGSGYAAASLVGEAVLDPILILNGGAVEPLGLLAPYSFIELVVLGQINPALASNTEWFCSPRQRMTRADVEVTGHRVPQALTNTARSAHNPQRT
jgi:hypothetical protein